MRSKKSLMQALEQVDLDMETLSNDLFFNRVTANEYHWQMQYLRGKQTAYNYILGREYHRKNKLGITRQCQHN